MKQQILPGSLSIPPCFQLPDGFTVGMEVGAGRWPWHGAHPDCWGKPWKGMVLSPDDPRAWESTIAFPGTSQVPTRGEVLLHLWSVKNMYHWAFKEHMSPEMWRKEYDKPNTFPILWDFDGKRKVFWARPAKHDLDIYGAKPYKLDLLLWKKERRTAMQQVQQANEQTIIRKGE